MNKKLDLDYIFNSIVESGSCYTGVDADELLYLVRIARAAVAWRDAWSTGYATAAEYSNYRITLDTLIETLTEAGA